MQAPCNRLHGIQSTGDLLCCGSWHLQCLAAASHKHASLQISQPVISSSNGTADGWLAVVDSPTCCYRLDMFDRLLDADPPMVRKTTDGDLIKCMDDQREGFQVDTVGC